MNEREMRQADNLAKQAIAELRARVDVLEGIVLKGDVTAKTSRTPPSPPPATTKKDH